MRGHNRNKPKQLKELQGTVRKDRDGDLPDIKSDLSSLPPAPKTLKSEGLIYYNEQGNKLLNLGVLNEYNIIVFLNICFMITKLEYFARKMNSASARDVGLYSGLYIKFQQSLRLSCSEFGLTPASLGKIKFPKKEKKSKLETYLNE